MRAYNRALTFRPNDKTRHYLSQIGFIDLRTGSLRRDAPNFSKFMNEVIQHILENGQHSKANVMPPEELIHSYWDFKTRRCALEYNQLNDKMKQLQEKRDKAEALLLENKQSPVIDR